MDNIVLIENNSLTAKPFTNSKIIADGVNLKHHTITKVIRNFESDFNSFGDKVGYNIEPLTKSRTGQSEKVYTLSEQQATLLFAYLKNTKVVRQFKIKLVKAFYAMAKELQSRQITRQAGITHRRSVTDSIKAFIPDSTHKKFAYKIYTDLIYKAVLGMNKKQYQQSFNIPQDVCIKDYLTTKQMEKISKLEDLTGYLLELGQSYNQIKDIIGGLDGK